VEGHGHQSQFEKKKNQRVFFFEQTAQASTCQTFERPRVYAGLVLRQEVAHIAAAFQALRTGCRQPDNSGLEGELQNEYRNDFNYRPGCVPAWWRRLVLGTRTRLTQPVLQSR
jgi:hypothetical protein